MEGPTSKFSRYKRIFYEPSCSPLNHKSFPLYKGAVYQTTPPPPSHPISGSTTCSAHDYRIKPRARLPISGSSFYAQKWCSLYKVLYTLKRPLNPISGSTTCSAPDFQFNHVVDTRLYIYSMGTTFPPPSPHIRFNHVVDTRLPVRTTCIRSVPITVSLIPFSIWDQGLNFRVQRTTVPNQN